MQLKEEALLQKKLQKQLEAAELEETFEQYQARMQKDQEASQDSDFEREEAKLRSQSLDLKTTRIEASQYKSKLDYKGRYGVTVPKPFGFEIREKARPKSIRERKIE